MTAPGRTILLRHTAALLRKSFRSQSRQTQTNLCQVHERRRARRGLEPFTRVPLVPRRAPSQIAIPMLVLTLLYLLQLFVDDVVERQAGAVIDAVESPELIDPSLIFHGDTSSCRASPGGAAVLPPQELLVGADPGVSVQSMHRFLSHVPERTATVFAAESFPEQGASARSRTTRQ